MTQTTFSVRLATTDDTARWNAYVEQHPDGTVCHLFGWRSTISIYGHDCHYLLAETPAAPHSQAGVFQDSDSQNELPQGGSEPAVVGILPLVNMRGPLSSKRLVSMPYLDLGGILANDTATGDSLRAAALDLAQQLGALGIDLRAAQPSATERGDRYRLVLDLNGDETALSARVGSKVRNQIRKSEKAGLRTQRATRDGLEAFYTVFARNMRDLGSPVHSKRFFEQLWSDFARQIGLYLTQNPSGEVVAGAIELRYGAASVVPWASSLASARTHCPNHSLYWRILRDAREAGCGQFDFGRSTIDTGTFRFKKQWGAEPLPLGWQFFSADGERQEEPYLDPRRHRLVRGVWRRLPVWLANRLGARIRGQLAQ